MEVVTSPVNLWFRNPQATSSRNRHAYHTVLPENPWQIAWSACADRRGRRKAVLLAIVSWDNLVCSCLKVDQPTAADPCNLCSKEFKLIFRDRVHSGRGFHVGSEITRPISSNRFLPVRDSAGKLLGQDRDAGEEQSDRK